MFTFEEWVRRRWAKEANARRVVEAILMPAFWNTIVYILKVMGPLVWVLHLANNERKLVMGNLHEAMDRTNYYESFQWEWRQNCGQHETIMSKYSILVQKVFLCLSAIGTVK